VTPSRESFLSAVLVLEGVPYKWGGKSARGIDCSGLVTLALKACGGPDLRQTHNSDRLWLELPEVVEPSMGDLAFYGSRNDPAGMTRRTSSSVSAGRMTPSSARTGAGERRRLWRRPTQIART
jgi:cell wall-associated NlpC family hydrolase